MERSEKGATMITSERVKDGEIFLVVLDSGTGAFTVLAATTDRETADKFRDTFNEDASLAYRTGYNLVAWTDFLNEYGLYPPAHNCRIARFTDLRLGLGG